MPTFTCNSEAAEREEGAADTADAVVYANDVAVKVAAVNVAAAEKHIVIKYFKTVVVSPGDL